MKESGKPATRHTSGALTSFIKRSHAGEFPDAVIAQHKRNHSLSGIVQPDHLDGFHNWPKDDRSEDTEDGASITSFT